MAFLEEVQVSELSWFSTTGWSGFDGSWIIMGTPIMSKFSDKKDNFQLLSEGPMAITYWPPCISRISEETALGSEDGYHPTVYRPLNIPPQSGSMQI
jgi:hypothetical protein